MAADPTLWQVLCRLHDESKDRNDRHVLVADFESWRREAVMAIAGVLARGVQNVVETRVAGLVLYSINPMANDIPPRDRVEAALQDGKMLLQEFARLKAESERRQDALLAVEEVIAKHKAAESAARKA